jgi:lysophospholipase L1-like esterase
MIARKLSSIAALVFICLVLLAIKRVLYAPKDVAFLGDSITESWPYPVANLGVFGNTTTQMLNRFYRLIPGHGYRKVVILGGTNDVLLGIDPATTVKNLETMGNLATAQHAEPILCDVPPIDPGSRYFGGKDYGRRVLDLNNRIVRLAAIHHWKLVDYYSPLVGHPSLFSDGVHPKRTGYLMMELAFLRQIHPLS